MTLINPEITSATVIPTLIVTGVCVHPVSSSTGSELVTSN